MKIVVLDGAALNPGDLSWDWLKAFGEYEVYDRTPGGEAEIIRLRYAIGGGEAMTQRETAQRCGISRSYVSRIEKKAIEKLRAALQANGY